MFLSVIAVLVITGLTVAARIPSLPASCLETCDSPRDFAEYCAPQIIIGGAMKCGTNAISHYLSLHPAVGPVLRREQHFYSSSKWVQPDFRREYFSMYTLNRENKGTNRSCMIDRSPSYIESPDVVARILADAPNSRIIFVLCNPAERLWSEYYHYQARVAKLVPNQLFAKPFPEFANLVLSQAPDCSTRRKRKLFSDIERTACKVSQKGFYSKNLESFSNLFARNQVFLCDGELLQDGSTRLETLDAAFAFLGLSPLPLEMIPHLDKDIYVNPQKPSFKLMDSVHERRIMNHYEGDHWKLRRWGFEPSWFVPKTISNRKTDRD